MQAFDFKNYIRCCNNDVTNLTSVNLKILATVNFAVTLHRQRTTNPADKAKRKQTSTTNKNHRIMATVEFQTRLMSLQANLLNFAYMLTSNRDDAHDLVQDTTLKALDNADKYVENTNFKGWVFTIMRNIFINNYRRVMRNATVVDQTEDLYHLNLSQDSGIDSPEESYSVQEFTAAINEFPEKYRIPFSMHVAGYKYNEIADETGLPLGTVKSRIFFARQQLQTRFADYR